MKKEGAPSTHWDLMLATVKEVAARDQSSVSRLEEEFLEEFGYLPTSELIDYFADLLNHDKEKTNRKKPVQKSDIAKKIEIGKKAEIEHEIDFTNKMAANHRMTVLSFRKLFENSFGTEPPVELLARFLKRLAYRRQRSPQGSDKGKKNTRFGIVEFVENFISGQCPTVFKFRAEFLKKFGEPPTPDMIAYFLDALSKKNCGEPCMNLSIHTAPASHSPEISRPQANAERNQVPPPL